MDRRDFMKKAILSSLMLSSGALSLLKSGRSMPMYKITESYFLY